MAKLRIARGVLVQARERGVLNSEEKQAVDRLLAQGGGKGPVSADVAELPMPFLKALLDDARLTAN
jgi:hypothetical protein